jgi:hypothetical protein
MLVGTPQTDSLQAEASVLNPKIAHWPYSLAIERPFARFDLHTCCQNGNFMVMKMS